MGVERELKVMKTLQGRNNKEHWSIRMRLNVLNNIPTLKVRLHVNLWIIEVFLFLLTGVKTMIVLRNWLLMHI